MAVTLGTEWKKVCEVSTKLSSNLTGYTRLYMKYGNRSGLNDTIYYEIRQLAYNPYGSYFGWQWDTAIAWSIKSGNTTKANGSFTQPAIYSTNTDSTANEVVRASGSYVQPHNSDGTFSDTLTFTAPIYNSSYNTTGDIVLPNIAVNPTLTINSSTDMTTSGSTINYTLGSTNGRSTKIQYSTNNSTWVDWKTKTSDNTYNETLPSLLSSFPNTYTPTVYFRAITGNYSSGSKSKTITISSSIKPSISSVVINPVNTYSVLTNNNLFVKNLTKPRITTTASAYSNGGATLKQYDLTALGGYNSSISKSNVGNNYTYGTTFQKSGSYTATVKVIDTRGGNVSKTSSAITVIDYYNPSITSVSVQRCTSNGTLSDTGTYCKLSVTYKIAPITSGSTSYNTKSLSYSINNTTGTITLSSYNTTVSAVIGGGNLNTNSSYPVTVTLKDLTTTVNQTVTLPTSFVLVSKRNGGKGIAFGKIAETDDFRCGLKMYDENNHRINGTNGRNANIDFVKTEAEQGTKRTDIVYSGTTSRPNHDGYVETYFWDNSGTYDTQIFIPNFAGNRVRSLKIRGKNGSDTWTDWYTMAQEEFVFNTSDISTANTDLNDYKSSGLFFFNNANTPSNKPLGTTASAGYLEVIKRTDSDLLQRWTTYGRINESYTRLLNAGTWGAWYSTGSGGAVLYDGGTTGTNGTVTLSKSASNYNYLEIFYRTNDTAYSSVKVYNPNGKRVSLMGIWVNNSTPAVYFKVKVVYINGTSITNYSDVSFAQMVNRTSGNSLSADNYVSITRVEGFM